MNGQKVWASGGTHADWCLLLARTDPDAPKRNGISYFLLDMTTPGIEVRPIRKAIGESHFCEMFLNDVSIPAANLVGAENAGWQVAQATLGAERGMTMLELAERLGNAGFRWLVAGVLRVDDPIVADRLAQFETEITGLRGLCRNLVEDNEAGTAGPADASIVKLYYSELLQRLTDFGAEIGGLAAQTRLAKPMSSGWESGSWVLDFIGSWEWTIPGGSSEIQRTIIGERASACRGNRAWPDGTRIRGVPRRTAVGRRRPARQGSNRRVAVARRRRLDGARGADAVRRRRCHVRRGGGHLRGDGPGRQRQPTTSAVRCSPSGL